MLNLQHAMFSSDIICTLSTCAKTM